MTVLTTSAYWDNIWGQTAAKRWRSDLALKGLDRFLTRQMPITRQMRLLELGCGGSAAMSYFAQRWDARVDGIDSSAVGCDLTRQILARDGARGNVICGDALSPEPSLEGKYNIVFSAGLVEHFTDTEGVLRTFGRYLRPGGILITCIPNLAGWYGTLVRLLTPEIAAKHVPLRPADLAWATQGAGMNVTHCDYLLPLNLGVLHLTPIRPRSLRNAIGVGLESASRAVCALMPGMTGRWSPYAIVVGEKRK